VSDPYSTLLAVAHYSAATAGYVDFLVVPAGSRAVILSIDAWGAAGAVGLNFRGQGEGERWLQWLIAGANKSFSWAGHQVVNGGSAMQIAAEGGSWGVRASGYLLSDPA